MDQNETDTSTFLLLFINDTLWAKNKRTIRPPTHKLQFYFWYKLRAWVGRSRTYSHFILFTKRNSRISPFYYNHFRKIEDN